MLGAVESPLGFLHTSQEVFPVEVDLVLRGRIDIAPHPEMGLDPIVRVGMGAVGDVAQLPASALPFHFGAALVQAHDARVLVQLQRLHPPAHALQDPQRLGAPALWLGAPALRLP